MGWVIERDLSEAPIRLWWDPNPPFVSLERIAAARAAYVSSLPMPAMREWAKQRGLIL